VSPTRSVFGYRQQIVVNRSHEVVQAVIPLSADTKECSRQMPREVLRVLARNEGHHLQGEFEASSVLIADKGPFNGLGTAVPTMSLRNCVRVASAMRTVGALISPEDCDKSEDQVYLCIPFGDEVLSFCRHTQGASRARAFARLGGE